MATAFLCMPHQVCAAPTASSSLVPYLAQLSLDGAEVSPAFRPTTLYYSVSVGETTDSLNIRATPQELGTNVTIDGNQNLQSGTNIIHIVLTSPEKTTLTYTLTVNKAGTVNAQSADLKSLDITNWTLSPIFSPNTKAYTTDVESTTDHLDIKAVAENQKSHVVITGNGNFKAGLNQVKIKVTSEDGSRTKTYTITVNKLPGVPKNLTPEGKLKPWYQRFWPALLGVGALVIVAGTFSVVVITKRHKSQS